MFNLIIVDDEKATREKLIENIEWDKLNIKFVGEAKDGLEGLELANQIHPDIILMDVRMPKMNGIECATQIKKADLKCKIIFLSGFTDKEYLKSAIQLNAIDYIEKPIDLDELFTVLKKTTLICQEESMKKQRESGINNKIQQNSTYIKQDLALEMIMRNIESGALKKKFEDIQVNIPLNENYRCILLRFNVHKVEGTDLDMMTQKEQVLEAIYKDFSNITSSFIAGVMDGMRVVIHIYGKNAENTLLIKEAVIKIQNSINLMFGNKGLITVGIGKTVRGIENVYNSYQNAKKAIQESFFKGYDSINFYEDRVYTDKSICVDDINQKLRNYLDDGNYLEARYLLEDMRVNIKKQSGTLEIQYIQGMFLSIMLNISSMARENALNIGNEWNDEQLHWVNLLNIYTMDEVYNFIIEKLEVLFKQVEEQKGKSKKIRAVMEFIKYHYKDEISVALIADQMAIGSTYLSTLFKKETGIVLGEYIESVRIEKAKQLLVDDRMKLAEVSRLVGYKNSNYFTTVFKKVTGEYPSEYRRKSK